MGIKLDNIETNGKNFKHLETTKDIEIMLTNETGDPLRPDPNHKWIAKVADSSGYIGDYAVKVDNTKLIVDSADFTQLNPGQYSMEVWETWTDSDGDETSIYPSPTQRLTFTITANISDKAGKQIKQIGFQDVVDKAVLMAGQNLVVKATKGDAGTDPKVDQKYENGKNIVTITIPKGDQGNPGITPHVDATTGDWFIGTTDTKVHAKGDTGPAPTLKIGTVTKLAPDAQPTVTLVLSAPGTYTLNIGLPQGVKGDKGDNAADYGKVLADLKKFTTDYIDNYINNGKW